MCLVSYICTLCRGHGHLQNNVFPGVLVIRICATIMTYRARILTWIILFLAEESYCELNYHEQKTHRTLRHHIWKHWSAVLTLLGLIRSVYRDLHHWISSGGDHGLHCCMSDFSSQYNSSIEKRKIYSRNIARFPD